MLKVNVMKGSRGARSSSAGQTLLIVVLIMVVSLTIALSAASRSIVNLKNTTEEENSQRAFAAAEAGVERALKTGSGIADPQPALSNNAIIASVDFSTGAGKEFLMRGGNIIPKDDGADIWLSDSSYSTPYPAGQSFFTIYWGESSDDCTPSNLSAAIEVIVISGTRNNPVSKRYAYDPCSRGNNFATVNPGSFTIGEKTFKYRSPNNDISISSGLIARVVPLYSGTSVGASTCNHGGNNCGTGLPPQGKEITSTGVAGDTTRKIKYFQGFPELPVELFQYIIFSP